MRLAVRHETRYRFDPPLAHGLQRLRLSPKESHGQSVRAWRMALTGGKVEVAYEDHNANHVTLISLLPGTDELVISCEGVVDTSDRAGVVGRHVGRLPLWAFQGQTALTRPGARLKALVAPLAGAGDDRLAQLHALSQAVLAAVSYAPGHTDVRTTAEEALMLGAGSARTMPTSSSARPGCWARRRAMSAAT